ncbi:hypothetical protein GCM10009775_18620 [Microbacterium aoyamense]|uniref:alpha-amylase n=1 Tax=Microbacterium aoyamense TaxID=344166 RepID=A0ABP5AZG0_9MICO|nr:cell wall-binding repeat-containing protein [Microbacterium aoyamense]
MRTETGAHSTRRSAIVGASVAALIVSLFAVPPAHADEEPVPPSVISVEGRLLTPDGAPAAGVAVRALEYGIDEPIEETLTAADGRFQIAVVTDRCFELGFAGDHRFPAVTLTDRALEPGRYRDDARSFCGWRGPQQSVGDRRLIAGVTLSGSIDITGLSGSRELEILIADDAAHSTHFTHRAVGSDGVAEWSTLAVPGSYFVRASIEGTRYVEYFGGGTTDADAQRVTVDPSGATELDFDVDLPLARVTGRITDAAGAPCVDEVARLADGLGVVLPFETTTDDNGRYSFAGVEPGDYVLVDAPWGSGCRSEDVTTAFTVVGPGEHVVDASWRRDERIVARVAFSGGSPAAHLAVHVSGEEYIPHRYTDHSGLVEFAVEPGVYRLGAFGSEIEGETTWTPEITVAEGETVEADLTNLVGATRFGGQSRYDTAVAITRSHFASGVERVYLANGTGLADALAAAPVAGAGGDPILLTQRTAIPGATWAELRRLQPKEIVLLGGGAAIDESLVDRLAEAARIAPQSVVRWSGADRYATAAAIAESAFPEGAETVFVANGAALADALAAAPVAGSQDTPILLVGAASVPASTVAAIEALGPSKIVVLGGKGVVSDAAATRLSEIADGATIERWSGVDRYATAAAIAAENYPDGAASVFVASGAGLVDALAAAPVAARDGAPLILVRQNAIPPSVTAALPQLGPSSFVLFGDDGVISHELQTTLRDLTDPSD